MTPAGLMMPVVDGPASPRGPDASRCRRSRPRALFGVVVRPDRGMRIIFYGTAASLLGDSTVRLYVRRSRRRRTRTAGRPSPARPSGRNRRRRRHARHADCFGAPCYDLPAAATEAMLATAGAISPSCSLRQARTPSRPRSPTFDRGTLGNVRLKDVLDAYRSSAAISARAPNTELGLAGSDDQLDAPLGVWRSRRVAAVVLSRSRCRSLSALVRTIW